MEVSSDNNKWNLRNLEPPPLTTYKTSTIMNITPLKKCCEAAQQFFGNQSFLINDAALLSRTVYRMKNKFRMDKGFKFMQKLNKTLKKYFEINFITVINDFYELLPEVVKLGSYLPTNNMLDYVIVRLQGLVALMNYISETAKTGAYLMEQRISIGHFWKMAFYAYALLSRIWYLSNDVIKFSCKLYNELLPLRNILSDENKNNWIGENYKFPINLESWLNIKDLEEENNYKEMKDLTKSSDLIEFESLKLSHNEKLVEEIQEVQPQLEEKKKSAFELMMEDEEMVIEEKIEENQKVSNKKVKTKKKKKKNQIEQKQEDISSLEIIENLSTLKILKKFLEKENKLRSQDRNKCIYKHLDALQWKMAQGRIKKWCSKASGNEKKESLQLEKSIAMLKSLL